MTNTSEQANQGVQGMLENYRQVYWSRVGTESAGLLWRDPWRALFYKIYKFLKTQYKTHLYHGETVSKVKHPHSSTIMKSTFCGIQSKSVRFKASYTRQ